MTPCAFVNDERILLQSQLFNTCAVKMFYLFCFGKKEQERKNDRQLSVSLTLFLIFHYIHMIHEI